MASGAATCLFFAEIGRIAGNVENHVAGMIVDCSSGVFLYYAIAVDQTMLEALKAISAAQAHATTTTMGGIVWLLN